MNSTPVLATGSAAYASANRKMLARMLWRATLVPRRRGLAALLAVVVAAAVSTAMMDLYVDAQAKLQKEFRGYGANIVVLAPSAAADAPLAGKQLALPPDALARVEAVLAGRGVAVPFAYTVASTSDGSPIVVAGTEMAFAQKLNRWWSVTAWPASPKTALLGERAAGIVLPQNQKNPQPFELWFQGRSIRLAPVGRLHTGAAEDSRIFIPLDDFSPWTGLQPNSIEIAASGSPEEINDIARRLSLALPEAQVRPVRQITEAEARVLGKTRTALLVSILLIIITAALCLLSTLTAWVLDQRRNFAVMKALGASERTLGAFFAAEAAFIGVIGAILGFVIGVGIAAWIGRVNFHAPVVPRLSVFPVILLASVAVALLAAVLPMALLARVQPARILKGE